MSGIGVQRTCVHSGTLSPSCPSPLTLSTDIEKRIISVGRRTVPYADAKAARHVRTPREAAWTQERVAVAVSASNSLTVVPDRSVPPVLRLPKISTVPGVVSNSYGYRVQMPIFAGRSPLLLLEGLPWTGWWSLAQAVPCRMRSRQGGQYRV